MAILLQLKGEKFLILSMKMRRMSMRKKYAVKYQKLII